MNDRACRDLRKRVRREREGKIRTKDKRLIIKKLEARIDRSTDHCVTTTFDDDERTFFFDTSYIE